MTAILNDTFTDATNAINIQSHTPETGGAWTRDSTIGSVIIATATGFARATTTDPTYYSNATTPPSAAYDVGFQFVYKTAVTTLIVAALGRYVDVNNHYGVRYASSTGTINVYKKVAGSTTTLISYAITPTADQSIKAVVRLNGSTLTLFVDDVDRGSATDTSFSAAGKIALFEQSSATPSSTTGAQFDRIFADTLPAGAPTFTVAPAVTGTAAVGSTLSCNGGTATGAATITKTYQWKRDGSAITGATGSTYVVTSADAGTSLSCDVTATNGSGSFTQGSSNAIAIPAAPASTTAPVLSRVGGGTSYATGDTVSCDGGTFSGAGVTKTYQWYRGAAPITGQTGTTYDLVVSDEGASVTCRVTATNGGGTATANSNAIVPTVTAPLSDASFLTYYSGGTGNTDPAASIGGARGGTYPGGLSKIFDVIPGTVAQAGAVFYRVVYVRNTHSTATAAGCAAYIEQQLTSPGLQIAVGVPTEAAGANVAALASGTTPPAGVTFTSTSDPAAGAAFGDLTAGQARGLHVRLTVTAGAAQVIEDDFVIAIQGSAA